LLSLQLVSPASATPVICESAEQRSSATTDDLLYAFHMLRC
jgi:hypothetical protein